MKPRILHQRVMRKGDKFCPQYLGWFLCFRAWWPYRQFRTGGAVYDVENDSLKEAVKYLLAAEGRWRRRVRYSTDREACEERTLKEPRNDD